MMNPEMSIIEMYKQSGLPPNEFINKVHMEIDSSNQDMQSKQMSKQMVAEVISKAQPMGQPAQMPNGPQMMPLGNPQGPPIEGPQMTPLGQPQMPQGPQQMPPQIGQPTDPQGGFVGLYNGMSGDAYRKPFGLESYMMDEHGKNEADKLNEELELSRGKIAVEHLSEEDPEIAALERNYLYGLRGTKTRHNFPDSRPEPKPHRPSDESELTELQKFNLNLLHNLKNRKKRYR